MKLTFPSSSNPAKCYTVTVAPDGQTSCDCPAWRFKKGEAARTCKHVKQVAAAQSTTKTTGAVTATTSPETEAALPQVGFVNPMLAQPLEGRTLDSFGDDWWLEEKFDGHRVIVAVNGTVRAWSRPRAGKNGVGLARVLPPHIATIMAAFPGGTYDGELVAPGGNSWDVVNLDRQADLVLVLFDVLRCDGQDLLGEPAEDRRAWLDALGIVLATRGVTTVRVAERRPVTRAAVEAIWDRGGEGAILKRREGRYRPGARSADWLKVKRVETAVLTVVGFEAGKLGPCATVLLKGEVVNATTGQTQVVETSVKTKNNDWLRIFAAQGASYIGRRLRIEHQGLFKDSVRHPMMDHFVEGGE